jgi:hypothetical protein
MVAKREDGSNRNGYYKITGRGIMFAEKKLLVNQHFYMFNNKFDGFGGEEINIQQALGKRFDYNLLMGIIPPGAKTDKEAKKQNNQPSLFY